MTALTEQIADAAANPGGLYIQLISIGLNEFVKSRDPIAFA